MLVVDYQAWPTPADSSSGDSLVVRVVDFQLIEIRLDFSIACARIDLETCLVGKVNLDVTFAVVDLGAANFVHAQFDRSVFILQAYVAGDAGQANIFRSRIQAQRTDQVRGLQIAGVQIEVAVEPGKIHIGARRLEHDRLTDLRELQALHELAIEVQGALDVLDGNIVGTACD